MAILLSFLLLLLLPLLFLFISKNKKHSNNLPSGPTQIPFIGNLHQIKGSLHTCLHDLSKKHGPMMLLRLGVVRMVVITSSEGAEEVLKTHDLECCTRPTTIALKTFSRNGNDIGSGVYGETWRELRKLSVREFFSVKKVQSFRYVREEECDLLVKKLKESALKQSPVNLSTTLFCLTGSIVSRTAFGQSFFENKHIGEERVEELMLEAHKNMSLKFTDLFPTGGLGWFLDVVDTFLDHIIDDHQSKTFTQDRPDLIDAVLEMIHKQEDNESFKLTIDHLKGISTNIYLAGVDTSAITMIWAMAELVRNPRVMKKVQDEIRTCIGSKQKERLAEEEIDKLQYLKLVVKETLRLHPPAPLLLPRETMSHIKIQGYDIPPKILLLINAWSIGRDPKYWKDPEEFIPERFIDSPVDYRGKSFEFLPFGSGRRICPGMASAIATIELGLLNLLYYFDWSLPEEKKHMDMEEAGVVTVVKKIPLELIPSLHQ
ncbi:BnaAnng14290D [Brassica napus]|uniref:BnaAnng14290D protein n=1 Tax=Brassica napus TaxID=3708 RepID=A0A078J2I6_BRANA|nr:BnaAnng14290D [Brassica napus]